MTERKTRRLLEPSKLIDVLPVVSGLIIKLNISAEINYSSYVASVSTDAFGNVSGGGTQTSKFESYYFGAGVENISNISKRVQFEIHEMDADNYIVGKSYIWADIEPGTRRRLWLERPNHKSIDFKKWQINTIGIAASPAGGQAEKVPSWEVVSRPKINIYELFSLSKTPLEPKGTGCCGCLVTLVMAFFGLIFLSILLQNNFDIGDALNELFRVVKYEFIKLVNKLEPMGKEFFESILAYIMLILNK